jgi:hypothetical protein
MGNPYVHFDLRHSPPLVKSANSEVTPEESMEGRGAANGKLAERNTHRAQDRERVLTYLQRVGERAKEKKQERFVNLLSHIKVPLLREAYQRLEKNAAAGVDGETWARYGENLDARLTGLQRTACIATVIILCPCDECTSRRRMGKLARWAFPRWRTKSCSKRCG